MRPLRGLTLAHISNRDTDTWTIAQRVDVHEEWVTHGYQMKVCEAGFQELPGQSLIAAWTITTAMRSGRAQNLANRVSLSCNYCICSQHRPRLVWTCSDDKVWHNRRRREQDVGEVQCFQRSIISQQYCWKTMGVKHSYFMLLEDFLLQWWKVILHISEAIIVHFTPLHLLDYVLLYRIPFYTQLL